MTTGWQVKKAISILIVSMMVTLLVAGCARVGESAPEQTGLASLVPEGATFIAGMQPDKGLGDPDIKALFQDIAAKRGKDSESAKHLSIQDIKDKLGVDPSSLTEAVVFGRNPSESSSDRWAAAIGKGAFDKDKLLSAIEQRLGKEPASVDYNGITIYAVETHKGQHGLAFLAPGTLVAGTQQAVKDVVDVFKGTKPHLTGQLSDVYNGLGNTLVKGASILPASLEDRAVSNLMGGFVDPALVLDAQIGAMSLDKSSTSFTSKVSLYYPTAAEAAKAHALLQAGLPLADLLSASSNPAYVAAARVLSKAQVSSANAGVTVTLAATPDQVGAIIDAMPSGIYSPVK